MTTFPNNYSQDETTPYGIDLVNVLGVPESRKFDQSLCIIDSVYDLGHPDLQSSNVNGYSGDVLNWYEDDNGHGTHVTGIISALGNNNQGVIGIVPNGMLDIYVVPVFDSRNNWVYTSDLVDAMEKCVRAGSNIINMSLGTLTYSRTMEAGCKDIHENEGVLLIASAGNQGNSSYVYPASFDSVMSVGSIRPNLDHSPFSQYNDQIDISAPGTAVFSTKPRTQGSYGYMSGTSSKFFHTAYIIHNVYILHTNIFCYI